MLSHYQRIKRNARLLVSEALHAVRHGFADDQDVVLRPIEVTKLERRILMSASPMAVMPEVAGTADEATSARLRSSTGDSGVVSLDHLAAESIFSATPATVQPTVELVVIDPSADDYQQMVADLQANTDRVFEILVLDPHKDGIAQITDALNDMNDVSAIYIVSHGDDGELLLGNQTSVVTVTASDIDGDTHTYSITGGPDQSEFSINATTGVLTFNTAPDFESPTDAGTNNVYQLQVKADDGNGGIDVQTISVTVTDVNDAPVITSGSTPSVAENQSAALTVTASDADLPADTVTFSLTGGADQAKFAISATTGDLTFTAAPDFETPTDTGADNVYEVQITADDGNGGTDVQLISVTVNPVNDNAPVFTSSAAGSLNENTTFVQTVTATDADLPGQSMTYSISGGIDAAFFLINGTTGNLSFVTAPDFEAPADFNANNIYEVQVTADDNSGSTTSQSISVTVKDMGGTVVVDTTSDVVDGNTASVPLLLANRGADGLISLREAIIATNQANDGAPDQIILPAGTYVLNRGTGDDNAVNGDLDINDTVIIIGAGARTTIIDGNGLHRVFHVRGNSTATVSGITVQGGNSGSGGGIHVETSSTLNLSDAVLTGNNQSGGSGGGAVHVHGTLNLDRVLIYNNPAVDKGAVTFHNASGGTLTNVTISGNTTTNQGGGLWTNSPITVTNSTIAFNTSTGDLSFIVAPDFEAAADFDADNIYEVQVTADDNAGSTTLQSINVTVNDVNDAPTITSSSTPVVAENQTTVLTITTTDDRRRPAGRHNHVFADRRSRSGEVPDQRHDR